MQNKEFVCACTLRTFGIDSERFEKICDDLRTEDIDIKFEEHDLVGKIFISKNSVDNIALENVLNKINVRLEDYIYADKDNEINYCLVKKLIKQGEMIAVAESITGGMICSSLCDIKGASDVFYEGIVSYNSGSKVRRLHVPATSIQEYTAVSKEVCEAMLKGVLSNKEVKYGIVTTGYANHNEKDKEGLAYVGYGSLENFRIEEVKFTGHRNQIRSKVANYAMFKLLMSIDDYKRKY